VRANLARCGAPASRSSRLRPEGAALDDHAEPEFGALLSEADHFKRLSASRTIRAWGSE